MIKNDSHGYYFFGPSFLIQKSPEIGSWQIYAIS